MMSPLAPFTRRTRIAYFSMEIAMRPEMHTYAGGLGVLAGDTARSCADLELQVVFVTLVSRAGYFRQRIDPERGQLEEADWWEPAKWCVALDAMVAVPIEGRPVWIRPWLFLHECPRGNQVPVLLLDTDLDQNASEDRTLTNHLYGGDDVYRLKQEIVLGIGGSRLLRALGFEIRTYHLNEGHAALLILDLMERYRLRAQDIKPGRPPYDIAAIREHCVFTTHTPIEAGHDRFPHELFERLLAGFVSVERRGQGIDPPNSEDYPSAARQGDLRVPAQLQHGDRAELGRRRGRVAEHAVAAAGGIRHQRHEGGAQRCAEPQRDGRLVGRGLHRERHRLVDRARPRQRLGRTSWRVAA